MAQDMNSFLKDIGIGGKSHVQKKEDTNNGIHTDKTRFVNSIFGRLGFGLSMCFWLFCQN